MRFKLVGCLSTAFIYCISVNSVAAIDIISKQGSTQTIASNPLRMLEREQRRQEREQRKRERKQRIEQQRLRREQLRLQRQQELERRQREYEAARQAATEQQRLEAERRRQYFESLSPEEKQAYIAKQRAQQEQAAKLFILWFGAMMLTGSSGDSRPAAAQPDYPDTVCGYGNDSSGNIVYNCRQR